MPVIDPTPARAEPTPLRPESRPGRGEGLESGRKTENVKRKMELCGIPLLLTFYVLRFTLQRFNASTNQADGSGLAGAHRQFYICPRSFQPVERARENQARFRTNHGAGIERRSA